MLKEPRKLELLCRTNSFLFTGKQIHMQDRELDKTRTCKNSHITETKSRSFCIKMNFSPAADIDFSRAVTFISEADKFSSVFDSNDIVLP